MDAVQYTGNATPKRFIPELFCPLNGEAVEMRQFTATLKDLLERSEDKNVAVVMQLVR
jgi:hypothetical protein